MAENPLPDGVSHWFDAAAANFETPDDLHRHGKPQLQIDYQDFMSPLMTGVFGVREFPTNIPTSAPNLVVAVRTREGKLAQYSYRRSGGLDIDTSRPIERELYDYSTPLGRQEIDNQAGRNRKEPALQALIDHDVMAEVRAPLPASLGNAQEQGLTDMQHLVALRGG